MALTTYTLTVTASGTVNVKGAYTEVVASTPYASSRLYLNPGFTSGASRLYLVDVATGASGSESVIVSNVMMRSDVDFSIGGAVALDVDIPAGTRIAMRVQSSTASASVTLAILLEDRALRSLTAPVTYGASTGFSTGTQVDPGATASAKGTYVQFVASTTSQIDAVLLCCAVVTAITGSFVWRIDLAIGAAGSEVVVIGDLYCAVGQSGDQVYTPFLKLPAAIPAGSRIAARCSCSVNTASQRILVLTVIGMQDPATTGGGATSVAYLG